jgi:hypothetical protein
MEIMPQVSVYRFLFYLPVFSPQIFSLEFLCAPYPRSWSFALRFHREPIYSLTDQMWIMTLANEAGEIDLGVQLLTQTFNTPPCFNLSLYLYLTLYLVPLIPETFWNVVS